MRASQHRLELGAVRAAPIAQHRKPSITLICLDQLQGRLARGPPNSTSQSARPARLKIAAHGFLVPPGMMAVWHGSCAAVAMIGRLRFVRSCPLRVKARVLASSTARMVRRPVVLHLMDPAIRPRRLVHGRWHHGNDEVGGYEGRAQPRYGRTRLQRRVRQREHRKGVTWQSPLPTLQD